MYIRKFLCMYIYKEGPLSYKLIYKLCYKYRKSIYKSHNYIYKFDNFYRSYKLSYEVIT